MLRRRVVALSGLIPASTRDRACIKLRPSAVNCNSTFDLGNHRIVGPQDPVVDYRVAIRNTTTANWYITVKNYMPGSICKHIHLSIRACVHACISGNKYTWLSYKSRTRTGLCIAGPNRDATAWRAAIFRRRVVALSVLIPATTRDRALTELRPSAVNCNRKCNLGIHLQSYIRK